MGRSDLNPKHYCHTLTNEIHEGSIVLFYVYKANPSNIGLSLHGHSTGLIIIRLTCQFHLKWVASFYFILEFSK